MIRVEVLEKFSLERFDELKNIIRKGKDENGYLYPGDTFECTQDLVEYLTGGNKLGKVVVKVIEVVPEISEEQVQAVAIAIDEEAKETGKSIEKVVNEIIEEAKETEIKPKKKKNKK
jgi:hypothetical protein